MALSENINDLEKAKFEEVGGLTAVRVKGTNFSGTVEEEGLSYGGKITYDREFVDSEWRRIVVTDMENRKSIGIQNRTASALAYCYESDLTANPSMTFADGWYLPINGENFWKNKNVAIFIRAETGTIKPKIQEIG